MPTKRTNTLLAEPVSAGAKSVDRRVGFAMAFIRHNCCNTKLSLRDTASHVNLSPSYFDRILRGATGRSFKSHVRMARMTRAIELLTDSCLLVKEIAWQLGYARTSHFDRDFKRECGACPTSWRRVFAAPDTPAPTAKEMLEQMLERLDHATGRP